MRMLFSFIIRYIAVALDGYRFAEIGRLWLKYRPYKVLVTGKDLTDIAVGLPRIGARHRNNAVSIKPERAGVIDGAVEVVFLCDDEDLLRLEDISRAVHALIGREARMIHEYILGGHSPLDGEALHHVHLVVALPAVVAAHKQLAARTVFIKLHTPQEPVLEHMARVIVIDSSAEHEYAVIVLARI